MPYLLPTDEEDEEKDGGAAPVGALGGGALAPGGVQQPAAPAQPQGPSTDFVSWDRILAANKDAAKGAADKMAGGLQKGAQDVQSKLAGAQANFGKAVSAGTPAGTQQAPTTSVPPSNSFGQPTKTPSPAAATRIPSGDPRRVRPKQQPAVTDAKYTGPNALSEDAGWGDILSGGRDAQGRLAATSQRREDGSLQGDSGIEALLQEEAQGGYTRGQSRMDAALLGSQGRGRFDELRKEYGGLLGQVGDADKASLVQSGAAKEQVAASNARGVAANAEAARKAKEVEATAAAKSRGPNTLEGYNQKYGAQKAQQTTDNDTEKWMQDTVNEFAGGVLGTDLGRDYEILNAIKSGPGTPGWDKLKEGITYWRGPAGWDKWLAAHNDAAARKARREASTQREQEFNAAYKDAGGDWSETKSTDPGHQLGNSIVGALEDTVAKPGRDEMFAADEKMREEKRRREQGNG
jgi:hypothetical protein